MLTTVFLEHAGGRVGSVSSVCCHCLPRLAPFLPGASRTLASCVNCSHLTCLPSSCMHAAQTPALFCPTLHPVFCCLCCCHLPQALGRERQAWTRSGNDEERQVVCPKDDR
ncbi:hypothetical protein DL89DRAFT_57806 [Linderina pennispora]|uniref:Uncharacterized protein n=1 Tax=Linderina pennispora TaxID=61395 RepID=A0A1Y1VRR3_9FUNG|nr:uncharacterized protein DL89DRAFT_57776 [Linderina pennispora]XP_040739125.1 uncharacterized protein DL89DRAFT_57806 [Linderina pennispora]ORX63968.1 hypothetical protein DL89DRAFT_57776 [Linderina pennispora]ORX63972.1 hypothetical protein DL89DRAFT_57806 [Linderina pennispora]